MSYPPNPKRGSIHIESPPSSEARPALIRSRSPAMKQGQYRDAWQADEDDSSSDREAFLPGKRVRRAHSPWWRLAQVVVVGGGLFLTGLGVGLEVTSRDVQHESRLVEEVASTGSCNPYDQHGVLFVNTTVREENKWVPVGAPASCDHTTNFLAKLFNTQMDGSYDPDVEFARNKTIVMLGDSVDRGHIVDFCEFAHGSLQSIMSDHEFSPPYPPGQERPPTKLESKFIKDGQWPEFEQSRPKLCHIGRFNLAIIFSFYYGFRPIDEFIVTREHYYPPAVAEERFNQILLPLVANVAAKYDLPSVPSLLTISPTFWGLLRNSQEDDASRAAATENTSGSEWDKAVKEWDPFRTMSTARMEMLETRMRDFVKHVSKAWRRDGGGEEVQKRPVILWRALHHVKEHHEVPYTGVQAIDQIGRAVVGSLSREGRAAAGGHSTWGRWARTWSGYATLAGEHENETEARRAGLGERLRIDEWGSLMLGMERYFRDDLHPMQLPGGYLWGNMILQQLKMAVEEEDNV